jgi:hypothetical protein
MMSSATPTPEPLSSGGGGGGASGGSGGKDDTSSYANRMKKKRRKMPIINPLVTLPMWPSKFFLLQMQNSLGFYFFFFTQHLLGTNRRALPFFYHYIIRTITATIKTSFDDWVLLILGVFL